MFLVALSIAMLFVAPLLAVALLKRPALAAGLDGFVIVAVGGIVVLHVVPQSAELGGALAVGAAALGMFLPVALHRLDDAVLARGPARKARDVSLFMVFLAGVVVHALFDGAALRGGPASEGVDALALGVILHRVPVGLALWVVARPKLGTARTLVVVATYAGGTVAGSFIGPELLAHASAPALAIFQAFVAGSILHIVAESPALPLPRPRPTPFLLRSEALRAPPPSKKVRAAGLVGSLAAVASLWLMESAHGEHGHDDGASFVDAFVHLALAIAPAALLSFVVVGVLFALYPEHAPLRSRSRGAISDAMRGVAAGLPHPLCSCAVAPLYDELVEQGASAARARAFLVAAPALGVPAVFVSARLLGLPFTGARVLGAALLAIAAGLSAKAARSPGAGSAPVGVAPDADASSTPSPDVDAPPRTPFARRLVHGLRHGLVDAVDHVGPWLVVGVAVAAAIEVSVGAGALGPVPPAMQIGVASLVALPLYLCAAGITPVAFVLLGKGATAGAALAFLLIGPTTSMPTFGLVRRHHGRAATVALAVVVVATAALCGAALDALVTVDGPWMGSRMTGMALGGGPVTLVQMSSLAVMTLLLGASFVRQGVRGFLVQVMSPQHAHAGDDAHGPDCAHDHGPALAPPPVVRIAIPFDPRGHS